MASNDARADALPAWERVLDRLAVRLLPARRWFGITGVTFAAIAVVVWILTLLDFELPLRARGVSILDLQFAFGSEGLRWHLARLGADGRALLDDALAFDAALIASFGPGVILLTLWTALGRTDWPRRFGMALALLALLVPALDLCENWLLARARADLEMVGDVLAVSIGVVATAKFALAAAAIGYVVWGVLSQRGFGWAGFLARPRDASRLLRIGAVIGAVFAGIAWLGGGFGLFVVLSVVLGGFVTAGLAYQPRWVVQVEGPVSPAVIVPMVRIPAGTFDLGSPETEEGHYPDEVQTLGVEVSEFEMARTPITRAQWRALMPKSDWPRQWASASKDDDLPANYIDWSSALRFCNALSRHHHLKEVYALELGSEGRLESVSWERAADGYRLPTECEWEYAARARSQSRYPWGDDERGLDKHAWWSHNAKSVQPVGTKPSNGFGLHDMIGNVLEWCWDAWDGLGAAPAGRDGDADVSRVVRGGSFDDDDPRFLRSAYRFRGGLRDQRGNLGFRCVRAPRRQND